MKLVIVLTPISLKIVAEGAANNEPYFDNSLQKKGDTLLLEPVWWPNRLTPVGFGFNDLKRAQNG